MKLSLDSQLARNYASNSQKARILTEQWVNESVFCPNCGHFSIDKYPNNQPVADFFCSNCKEDYELKSKQNTIGLKIVDGAYKTMIERLKCSNNPNFFFMNYDLKKSIVMDFIVIPKHFFIPEIIEKRKPLSLSACRAGWVGCNIVLKDIPQSGRIFIVKDGQIKPKDRVLDEWQKTLFLRDENDTIKKGWLLDIMKCIDKLGKQEFSLIEIYKFENYLSNKHSENHHIKDKIRQQLQILRDKAYIEFIGHGNYKLKII